MRGGGPTRADSVGRTAAEQIGHGSEIDLSESDIHNPDKAMTDTPKRFRTERLLVDEWHSLVPSDERLAQSVIAILKPSVTHALPDSWQGEYTVERAMRWIEERDQESTAMLIQDRSSNDPVGLMIVFAAANEAGGSVVRIGYMLAERWWGQGIGTELLKGFVDWARSAGVSSIVGGVERDNVASQRVMEKTGFAVQPGTDNDGELFYRLDIE